MEWFDTLLKLLGGIGGTAALVAVASWLAKNLALHFLKRDLEEHKQRLKDASERELERTKAELKQAAFQFETRYGRLHERAVNAIVAIFPALLALHNSVVRYVAALEDSRAPSKAEQLETVKEKSAEFQDLFRNNRILLPKGLYRQLDELNNLLLDTTNTYTRQQRREEKCVHTNAAGQPWDEAIKVMKEKIRPLLDRMHDEVQEIMGFSVLAPARPAGPVPGGSPSRGD